MFFKNKLSRQSQDMQTSDQLIFQDLSHTIENGLVTYKGLPAPIICDFLSRDASRKVYEKGTTFQIAKIDMVGNTGTYMDCPFHRYDNGLEFDQLPLEKLVSLPVTLIDAPYETSLAITPDHLKNKSLNGKAVLFKTGWDRHWNTETYYANHPYLTAEAASLLVKEGAILAGIDSYNIDNSTSGKSRPVHTTLLGAGILIVEHLCCLERLPANHTEMRFSAVPPKIKGAGSFPVRAFVSWPK